MHWYYTKKKPERFLGRIFFTVPSNGRFYCTLLNEFGISIGQSIDFPP